MTSLFARLNRSAKRGAMEVILSGHRVMVAGEISKAIGESAPGHLSGDGSCDPLQACNVCARRRQAEADAELARRIGGTR